MATFEEAGIRWLSPSDVSNFAANPAFWVTKKLLGAREGHAPAIVRADAVYQGVRAWLYGADAPQAGDIALNQFQMNMGEGLGTPEGRKEHDAILPMLDESVHLFQALGFTHPPRICRMFETVWLDGISCEFVTAPDFVFDDAVVFLKTTHQCPSKPRLKEQQQAALAHRKRGLPCYVLYATMSRGMVYLIDEEMRETAIQELVADAFALQSFLGVVQSPAHALSMLPLQRNHYLWKPEVLEVAISAKPQLPKQETPHGLQLAGGRRGLREGPSGGTPSAVLPDRRHGDAHEDV